MKNIKAVLNNETTKSYITSPEMESSFNMISKQLLPLVMEANSKILYQDLQENLVLTENSTMEDVNSVFEEMREDVRVDTVNLMESITDLYSDVSLTNEEKDTILAEAVEICFEAKNGGRGYTSLADLQDDYKTKQTITVTPKQQSTFGGLPPNRPGFDERLAAVKDRREAAAKKPLSRWDYWKKSGDGSRLSGMKKELMGTKLANDIRKTKENFLANKATGSSNIKALGQTFNKVGSVVGNRINTGFNQTRKTLNSSVKPMLSRPVSSFIPKRTNKA